MRCSFRVLAAFTISPGAAFEVEASRGDEAVKNSCLQAAFASTFERTKQFSRPESRIHLKSVDAVIAQRRLQERFGIKILPLQHR
jgi:hypothetical protein